MRHIVLVLTMKAPTNGFLATSVEGEVFLSSSHSFVPLQLQ